MKILFIPRLYYPHVGGVERHVAEVSRILLKKGHKITVLTEKYDKSLKNKETVNGVKIVRFDYPRIKLLGLLYVWWQIFRRRKLIEEADIVHVHDVFIWYLPFRFMYPRKKVFTTAHGLEFDNPYSKISLWQKRLAKKLSTATVGVGAYLEKFSGVKFDLVIYGAVTPDSKVHKKVKNAIVYLGRLDESTGLKKFLEWIKKNPEFKVEFCGDGVLRKECEEVGKVYGFVANTAPYLEKAEYCVPGGYLGAMEALNAGCKLKLFWHSKVRGAIWKGSPFIGPDARVWVKSQTWKKLAGQYLNLYGSY